MTILALAYHGFKKISTLVFKPNTYKAVEHLNDSLLKDIGMYREAGEIFHLNATPEKEVTIKKADSSSDKGSAILIPRCLEDSTG